MYHSHIHFLPDKDVRMFLPFIRRDFLNTTYSAADCDPNAPFIYKQVTEFIGKKESERGNRKYHRSVLYGDEDNKIAYALFDFFGEMCRGRFPANLMVMRDSGLYVKLINSESTAFSVSHVTPALDDEDNYVEAEITILVSGKDGGKDVDIFIPVSFHTPLKTGEDIFRFLRGPAWETQASARSLLPSWVSVASLPFPKGTISCKGLSSDQTDWVDYDFSLSEFASKIRYIRFLSFGEDFAALPD